MSSSLSEGVGVSLRYKFSASGTMNTTVQPLTSVDPGASGGQILRRVSSDLDLQKDTFQSEEIRIDRQVFDMRHAMRKVVGGVAGELSPGTYSELFQALFRGTMTAADAVQDNTTLTSVACDNATSTITFAGGNCTTGATGVRVGSILNFTLMTQAANNAVNFLVLAVDAPGRVLTVYPAPTTQVADVTFSMTVRGKRLTVPATGLVNRKLLIEAYYEDLDVSRIFKELRIGSADLSIQPNQPASVSFGMVGRDMEVLTGASAPFFASPADVGTTSILSGVSGVVQANGVTLGVMTGIDMKIDLAPDAPSVIGQLFTPNVFLGRFRMSGSLSVFFENATMLNLFLNETEFAILGYFTSNLTANSPAMSFYLPRVKATAAQLPMQGEGAQVLTVPFTALKGLAGNGIDATTFQIVDTNAL